jgi:ABC-type glutathione transport system ATPase component
MLFLVNPNALSAVAPNVKKRDARRAEAADLLECRPVASGRDARKPAMTACFLSAHFGGLSQQAGRTCATSKSKWARARFLGLVGESGSGKSTIALALLRLLEHKGASIQGRNSFRRPGPAAPAAERDAPDSRARDRPGIAKPAGVAQPGAAHRNANGGSLARASIRRTGSKLWKPRALELFERVSLPAEESFLTAIRAS